MTAFHELSRAERIYRIEGALPAVLRKLDHPAPTDVVVGRLAPLVGTTDKKGLAAELLRMAAGRPEATQDGSTFRRFGRECRRWVWRNPGAAVAPAAQPVAPPVTPAAAPLAAVFEQDGLRLEDVRYEVHTDGTSSIECTIVKGDERRTSSVWAPALPATPEDGPLALEAEPLMRDAYERLKIMRDFGLT